MSSEFSLASIFFPRNRVVSIISTGKRTKRKENLQQENEELRNRLAEVEETLRAIREGEVDVSTELIRQLRRQQEALRESEERFRTIAETLPALISLSRIEDSTILFTNTAYNEAFGFRKEEIIGRKGPDVYYDPAERAQMLDTIRKRGFVDNYQLKAKKSDGTPLWLLSSVRSIMYDGKPAIIGASIDITERKRVEEKLQTMLQRFYLILSSMQFGILLVTDDDRVEFANQAFCDIFGFKDPPSDLMNLSANELLEKIRPSYINPDAAIARIREIVGLGQPVRGEDVGMHGERTFIRDYIPIRLGEEKYGRLWVHVDITERKLAEKERTRLLTEIEKRAAELDATISSMAIGLIVYDQIGKASYMNTVAKDLLPQEIFLKSSIEERAQIIRWETEVGQPFPLERIPVARALHGETTHNVVIAAAFPDHKLWISASAAPIRTPDGCMLGVVASFVDISDRKKAEEELRVANEELTTFNRAMVGRELRMIELKKEINELCVKAGAAPRYKVDFEEDKS